MSSLVQRLKERKLFQWTVAYVAAAWLVFQAIEVLADPWNISPTLQRVVHVALGVGFFAAVVISWYHGDKGHQRVGAIELAILGGLLVIGGAGVALVTRGSTDAAVEGSRRGASDDLDPKAVAVLPLANLSPDVENEYFAAGIHDDILSQLAKIRDLTVISRTSVLPYAETKKNLLTIAEELGVAMVLEGSVRRSGDRVRVVVQLIDARTDDHVWSDTYDREMTVANVFEIQSDVAERIATALRSELTPGDRARLAQVPTQDSEAYSAYLRGNVYLLQNIGNEANLRNAQAMYERATEIDPRFALAYAALSRTHAMMVHQGHDRSEERRAQAKLAVDRALQLQPDLPEAHLALGSYYYNVFRDYDRALAALEIAERGMPGSYDLIMTQAYIAKRQGRFAEALAKLERGSRLNPNSTQPPYETAIILESQRRYSEAEGYIETVISLNPNHLGARFKFARFPLVRDGDSAPLREYLDGRPGGGGPYARWRLEYVSGNYEAALAALARAESDVVESQTTFLPRSLAAGLTHAAAGREDAARAAFDSALTVIDEALQAEPDDARLHGAKGLALAGLGRRAEAVRSGQRAVELMPRSLDVLNAKDYVLDLATIYAMVGDWEAALTELDRYLSGPGEWTLRGLMTDPRFAPLERAPGFRALRDKYER